MLNREDIINKLQNIDIPKENFIIVTGAALVLQGVKEFTSDIDLICSENYFNEIINEVVCEHFGERYIEGNNGNGSVRTFDDGTLCFQIDKDIEIFYNFVVKDIVFINGFKVASLNDIKAHKLSLGREKDYKDILMINEFEKDKKGKMLKDKIINRKSGIITYGITPPKSDNTSEKIAEITSKHFERLKKLDVDALVIYDIQDEADRNGEERPFPFISTINPTVYGYEYLKNLDMPKIIYNSVGKMTENELENWISNDFGMDRFSVFVGASSATQNNSLKLNDAYNINKKMNRNMLLGGIIIPERHNMNQDEHLRVISKVENGCSYFISQVIYNLETAKNFLSDYYYYCIKNEIEMKPILFTLTPCGSKKTLEFMKWLGISFPKWLENELLLSEDILEKSVELLKKQFKELLEFATEKGIPIGCNIESVSVRKVEIDASIKLVDEIRAMFLSC